MSLICLAYRKYSPFLSGISTSDLPRGMRKIFRALPGEAGGSRWETMWEEGVAKVKGLGYLTRLAFLRERYVLLFVLHRVVTAKRA